jgi:hypothetical protein
MQQAVECVIRRVMIPVLKSGKIVEESQGRTGTVRIVRCEVKVADDLELKATLVYARNDKQGNRKMSHDGRMSMVYLTRLQPWAELAEANPNATWEGGDRN